MVRKTSRFWRDQENEKVGEGEKLLPLTELIRILSFNIFKMYVGILAIVLQCFKNKGICDRFLLGTHQIKWYIDTDNKSKHITHRDSVLVSEAFIVH